MYRPDLGLFVFRLRRDGGQLHGEGTSPRYTAIALIGLASEDAACVAAVLGRDTVYSVCARLLAELPQLSSIGDVALVLWAASKLGHPDARLAERALAWLVPDRCPVATVELSWTLAALCSPFPSGLQDLRERVARRLLQAFDPDAGTFPHMLSGRRRFADHVSCFADLIYPIHALAEHASLTGSRSSLAAAARCARLLCDAQGAAGQWWWHYDRRTGTVVERYPVYAVHQDAMAPMALSALERAGGGDFADWTARGLSWLARSPELGGGSLIDDEARVVWRKVARREPAKLARLAQAAATTIHPALRLPGLDRLLPPGSIDHEDRPYHLGWLLYALRGIRQ